MYITIDCENKSDEVIREAIASKLNFPSYYGKNWDAFDECISDLEWIDDPEIRIIIENFANTDPEALIITILLRAVYMWKHEVEFQKTQEIPIKKLSVMIQ